MQPVPPYRWEVVTPAVGTVQVYGGLLSFSYLSFMLSASLLLSKFVGQLVVFD